MTDRDRKRRSLHHRLCDALLILEDPLTVGSTSEHLKRLRLGRAPGEPHPAWAQQLNDVSKVAYAV
jgi:hypothetical protein